MTYNQKRDIINSYMDKHHIVPKHMGGLDEDFNIMELSREDHAWAHLILHKLYGHNEDLWAANILFESKSVDISGENNPMADPEIRKKHKENHPFLGKNGEEGANYKDGRWCDDITKYNREYHTEYRKTDKSKNYRKEYMREYMREYRKMKNATI